MPRGSGWISRSPAGDRSPRDPTSRTTQPSTASRSRPSMTCGPRAAGRDPPGHRRGVRRPGRRGRCRARWRGAGLRAAGPPPTVTARLLRVRAPRPDHVGATWREVPETWYRLPVFYFSNVSEIRGPDEPVWAPAGSAELDFELEVGRPHRHAGDRPPRGAAEEAIGGYIDLQRLVGPRPPARGDRSCDWARRRARTSRPRSGRGWSRRTSWRTRGPGAPGPTSR